MQWSSSWISLAMPVSSKLPVQLHKRGVAERSRSDPTAPVPDVFALANPKTNCTTVFFGLGCASPNLTYSLMLKRTNWSDCCLNFCLNQNFLSTNHVLNHRLSRRTFFLVLEQRSDCPESCRFQLHEVNCMIIGNIVRLGLMVRR